MMQKFMYNTNPFTEEYYKKEKEWFASKCSQIKNTRVSIERQTVQGRVDGFLYKDYVHIEDVPIFKIDGEVWMSITPMEVESHFIPIHCAQGRVGVAGLGLGYYTQRILDKESVEEVVVYELNQEVIDVYLQNFGTHPKLTIIQGNVLEVCKNEEFDWFYNDIYQFRFDDKAFEDMGTLQQNNVIADYHFWTQEGYILSAIQEGEIANSIIPFSWRMRYYPFIAALTLEKEGFLEDYLEPKECLSLIEKYIEENKEWA